MSSFLEMDLTQIELKFRTSDHHEIGVDLALILQAETISTMVGVMNIEESGQLEPVYVIGERLATKDVFLKIVEWITHYRTEPQKSG